MTRRWQGEKINKIEKFLPQVSGETSIYLGPKNIIRTAVSDMITDVMLNPWVAEDLRYAFEWFDMAWKTRSYLAATGGTKYFKPENLQDAIICQGTTTADLQAALNAAATVGSFTRGRYVLIDQNIIIDDLVNIPADVALLSRNGSTITRAAGNLTAYLRVNSRSVVAGIAFHNLHLQFATTSAVDSPVIVGNKFTGTPSVGAAYIRDAQTQDNSVHSRGLIALNDAYEAPYFFYRANTQYFKCLANRQIGTYNISRMFLNHGGWGNEDAYNIMFGGIVAHGVLLDRRFSRGWYSNSVHNNWFEYVSEEGISIDIQGNGFRREDPSNSQSPIVEWFQGILDTVLITNTTGGNITGSTASIVVNKADITGIVANSHALVIMTGPLAGKYLRFNGVSAVVAGSSYRFQFRSRSMRQSDLASLVGEWVSIVIRADGNIYDSNTLKNIRDPYKLWGAGWHCTFTRSKVVRTLPYLPEVRAGDGVVPFKEQEISLTHVCGLNTMGSTGGGLCAIGPSNNHIGYNDADVGFSGQSYGPQAAAEARMGAFPNTIVGNRKYLGVTPTRNHQQGWVSGKNMHNVEDLGGEFRPEFARGSANQSTAINPTSGKFAGSVTIALTPGQLIYNVPHNLPGTPAFAQAFPGNAHALQHLNRTINAAVSGGGGGSVEVQVKEPNTHHTSADGANIIITFTSPPTAGNAVFNCEAHL